MNPMKDQTELQAIIWGRVQGVGFRITARRYALQLNLKGTVQNLEDGNVKIVAQGKREILDEFITRLKEQFGAGYIARIDINFAKPSFLYDNFQII